MCKLQTKVPTDAAQEISSLYYNPSGSDFACWKLTPNGSFSVKSGWEVTRKINPRNKSLEDIWNRVVNYFFYVHFYLEADAYIVGSQLLLQCKDGVLVLHLNVVVVVNL